MEHAPFILCVEGSRLLHRMVAKLCAELGLGCVHASVTAEALASIAQRTPAAVVAGFEQRDFSAASLVAALKVDLTRACIPIAVLTSFGGDAPCGFYQPDLIVRRNSDWERNLRSFLAPFRDAVVVGVGPRKRILVVDDSATTQRLTGSVLHRAGYEVTIAANGQQALDLLAAQRFDVILMDIDMPVMDGREAIRRIRGDGIETPVIAITALDVARFAPVARALGFDELYAKPIRREALLAAIAPFVVAPSPA